jgi:hypothetical protein
MSTISIPAQGLRYSEQWMLAERHATLLKSNQTLKMGGKIAFRLYIKGLAIQMRSFCGSTRAGQVSSDSRVDSKR